MAQKSAEPGAGSVNHEQKVTEPPRTRAGEKWTNEEKANLARLVRAGLDVEDIANQLQRSLGAVRSRITEKGLLATQECDAQLQAEFDDAMLNVYEVAAKRKYYATRFKQLLKNRGGVEAARVLLAQDKVQAGLERLRELDLLDQSTESLVLQERFHTLFTEGERQKARRRLESLGYFPK